MVRNLLPKRARGLNSPLLSPLWSAAFSFSKCHAVRKVPYDPNLLYLFDGEEFTHMAKLWTRGYDVYSPDKMLVMHDESFKMRGAPSNHKQGTNKPSIFREWSSNGQTPEYKRLMFDEAVTRVKTLLDMEGGIKADTEVIASLQQYGLGTKRTLDQFMQFTGVDTRQGVLFEDPCTARKWVPFQPDSHAELLDGDIWGLSAEIAYAGSMDIPLLSGGDVELYGPTLEIPSKENAAVYIEKKEMTEIDTPHQVRQIPRNPVQDYSLLWSVFLPIDSIVEAVIGSIDGFDGNERPHAVRNVKLLLLFLPFAVFLIVVGLYTITGKSLASIFIFNSEQDVNVKVSEDQHDFEKRV